MFTFFGRCPRSVLLVGVVALLPLAGCGGELYLNADDAVTEFDPFDRDPTDDDQGDGGDGANGDGTNGDGADVDGDSLLGDGFGDFDGDGGGGGCGFNPDPCPGGQECVEGACVAVCAVPRCTISRECCPSGQECVYDRICQPPCPSINDDRCGTDGSLCCDSANGFVCNEGVSCIKDCSLTGGGQLCGNNGQAGTFGTVCCDIRGAGPNDDDVCVFDRCVQRGDTCQSFLDCEVGEYCELTLDPDPTTGYCLPDEFPPDAPICQSPPDDLFSPTTEWSWVGVQLVEDGVPFAAGEVIPKCATNASTHCYREPCTDNPTTTAPTQGAVFRADCYRSVETIPTTADVDQVDLGGGVFVPEVVFKAYADDEFDNANGNVLVIADGRAEADLPASGTPSKQQRSKMVIYGETRGHVAIGNLDGDAQLELVTAHKNGLCAYDPYDTSGAPRANALKWCTTAGSLDTRYSGGAPHLADLDADGTVEIIIAGVIVRDNGASASILVDLGTTNQASESNTGARCSAPGDECFAVSALADVNLDGKPDLLAGDRAWTIQRNPTGGAPPGRITGNDGWVADPLWAAHYAGGGNNQAPVGVNIGDGRGFPGVGDFVDNRSAPYNRPTNTPEVAIVYAGAVYIVSGESGEVLRSPVAGSTVNLAFQLLNNRGGPPNIADFDGDGRPEVSFAGTGCMVVVDPDCAANDAAGRVALVSNPTSGCNVAVPTVAGPELCTIEVNAALDEEVGVLWQYQTQDQSSAVTGTSVFDFQGDGKAEVLYNDECFFRVFEGSTSDILYERPNSHRTATEYPIVVDVDGDSNSEIVVVSTGDQSSRYSSGRDRCGGPELNTAAAQTGCAGNGNRACGSLGGCGWNGAACQTCSAFVSQATCEPPIAATPSACSARADNTTACHVTGGCGMDNGDCRVCSDLDDQTECEAGSGCYWNTAEDPDRCRPTCESVRDRNANGITDECNATPNCAMAGATCAWRPNGCDWNGSACVQSCANAYDTSDADGNFGNECNALPACRSLLGTCDTWSYRRTGWEQYQNAACTCADHTQAVDCDAARGCRWSGSSCVVVTAANTAGNCGFYGNRTDCQAHVDDCIWDAYQGASGTCEENPRGQAYICLESTWGVTVFGDTSDLWVKTLPYWYEHPYHITNQDRFGRVVPDWSVCYTGSQCAAQTNPVACEATFVSGGSGPLCEFGDSNPDFYNNFRQNVPGFVPLNAPDLQVLGVVASLQNCPPQITVVARIVNKGRAGIRAVDANIAFYRLLTNQTPLQTAQTVTPFALLDLPVDLLPGGSVQVTAVYTVPSTEAPIDLDFRVIANPEFLLNGDPELPTFECNSTNNAGDVLDLDCTDIGG